MSPKGGGRCYVDPDRPARTVEPAIRRLNDTQRWSDPECDRRHGYIDSGKCCGEKDDVALYEITFNNERKKRPDTNWVCAACAREFAAQHKLVVP